MKQIKIFTIKLQTVLLTVLFVFFILSLLFFSGSVITSARSGALLWANSVFPSLFPFFIAIELLNATPFPNYLGKRFQNIMKPLFHVSGQGAYPFILGTISGYPTGAKIICDLRQKNLLSKVESERLLAFSNNSGPLFIIGTVGISMFADSKIGLLLLVTHLLASLTVGIIFRFWKFHSTSYNKETQINKQQIDPINFSSLGELLANSIRHALDTIFLVGGFIILFSVILGILKQTHLLEILSAPLSPFLKEYSTGILSGMLEMTNGAKQIAEIPAKAISINLILCAFLIGFGSLSVLFQVYSIIAKTDISIKPYFLGKLLHGFIAAIYTAFILHHSALLSFDYTSTTFFTPLICLLITVSTFFLLRFLFKRQFSF